ncbi:MAG: carboxypeptidase regulatory-like domain-containing protein, partial [Acidobacteria bacterium]|nr:carboxypeptidase regulatory-like domain-containing protein [Acidobacteriota bacterium]
MMRLTKWLLSCCLLAQALHGQTTFGTIVGSVKDPAGGVMAGVKVTVTNEGTSIAKDALTDAAGNYEVTHLNPGLYTIGAEFSGFQRHLHQHVNLETEQVMRIDIQMKVGQVTETVTVEGQAPLIESETTTVSDVRTGRQMHELPLNFVRGDAFGGGIFKYMSLSPGSFRYEGSSAHSFGGSRSFQNNFIMDGTSLGDQGGGQVTPAQPSFETIQEMKLTMVNNSAEYGAVATITVTSKSGTNQLHGTGFQQYSSGGLNARNFFQTGRPFRVYNEFGGSIGGPVVLPGYDGRNRTFFFGAFEGNRDHSRTVFNSSVPSLALRQGDFSQVFAGGGLVVIRDPTTGQPFPDNRIPSSRFSSVSAKAQERFYPAPNFGPPTQLNQNLRDTVANAPYWNHFDLRGDHRTSNKNSLYGRFSWRNLPTPVPEGELPNTGLRAQLRRIRNGSLVDTHVVSPSVVNEFRAGFAWHENRFEGPLRGLPIVRDLGIRGLTTNLDLAGVPEIQITGFSSVTQIDHSRQQDGTYDFIDNLTFVRGRHSLKVGFDFRKNQASREPIPITIFGRYSFTNQFTGFSYADFLLGIPETTRRTTPQGRSYGR